MNANLVLKGGESSVQLVHIETTELPRYFAVVSQITRQVTDVSAEGGFISTPQGTKVSFPPDACWRSTKVAVKVRLDTAFDYS